MALRQYSIISRKTITVRRALTGPGELGGGLDNLGPWPYRDAFRGLWSWVSRGSQPKDYHEGMNHLAVGYTFIGSGVNVLPHDCV